jgi:hypothetical protein
VPILAPDDAIANSVLFSELGAHLTQNPEKTGHIGPFFNDDFLI